MAHVFLLESLACKSQGCSTERAALTLHHFVALQQAGTQEPQTYGQRGEHGEESLCTWEMYSCNVLAEMTEEHYAPEYVSLPSYQQVQTAAFFKPYSSSPKTQAFAWLNPTGLN